MQLKPLILIVISTIMAFRVATFFHIPSKNSKVIFPNMSVNDSSFSIVHSNVRSLKRNLENFQAHLFDELDFQLSIIGVSETKNNSAKILDFDPNIPGYVFEYVWTPLASGGVGLYINDSLKYTVIDKNIKITAEEAFRVL